MANRATWSACLVCFVSLQNGHALASASLQLISLERTLRTLAATPTGIPHLSPHKVSLSQDQRKLVRDIAQEILNEQVTVIRYRMEHHDYTKSIEQLFDHYRKELGLPDYAFDSGSVEFLSYDKDSQTDLKSLMRAIQELWFVMEELRAAAARRKRKG